VHLKIKEFAAAIAWTYQCFRRTVHLEINEFNLLLKLHGQYHPTVYFYFSLANQIYML